MAKYLKTAMLAFALVMALGLCWRLQRLDETIDRSHAEVLAAFAERERQICRLGLQLALNRCSQDPDGLSSVEREPCRLVCYSAARYQTLWIEPLSEVTCQELR